VVFPLRAANPAGDAPVDKAKGGGGRRTGLMDLVANSVEEYAEIAVALARDPERLSDLRRVLRPPAAALPLCDGLTFARKMESAFRMMWQHWCESSR
jgi:protein O-GlcNAc transferase